ncbi:hypothetical protein THAOC_00869 [Thalassiosira oceanica]|uniref:Uncharacterized protein n=1 Tax=Thalassiosira oceanica TaxID=159749 RepID=K0TIB5_THAOC|nr:hypothetical protein THAOC_00869 [Thalassiosira oceanica]|eukprot:EJK77305.1 hypothetical protein THAOC_00869 [Thalassiosira oceanica]
MMIHKLSMFLVRLLVGLCFHPSFAWTNPSVAFAPECLANLALLSALLLALLLALVVTLASIYHLLRIAVDLIHRLLVVAVKLPGVAVSQIYRLSEVAGAFFGRPQDPTNPTLTPLSDAHDNCQPVRTPASDGRDLSLTSVSASLQIEDVYWHWYVLLRWLKSLVGRRSRVSWCPTVKFVPKTAKESFVRETGFEDREHKQMVERNNEETDQIEDVYDHWYDGEYGLPDDLAARLSSNLLPHIYREFPTLEDALAFEEKCLIAIGLRAKDKEPTLLNDERATAELTVAEPEPPTDQNPAAFDSNYEFDPFARNTARERQESESLRPPVGPQQPVDPQPPAKPLQFKPPTVAQNDLCVKDLPPMEVEDLDAKPTIAPTPLRRSERLMRKKAKAAVFEVPTSKMIGQPRREKAMPAQSAEPPAASRRIPRSRSKSTAVGLQSEQAVPSAHLRRSTRARRKPTRFSP